MHEKILAYHIDLKHPMWTAAYLEQTARLLDELGYNAVLLEVEDKLQFSAAPEIADVDALSPAEAAELAAMFAGHHLQVIPLVQTLGHAEYVLSKAAYAHLREDPQVVSQYDPVSLEARQFILQLVDDVIAAFGPTTHVHLGGDEAYHLGQSPKHAARLKARGVGGMYLDHMRPLFEHVLQQRLRPVIWADMILSDPEIMADFPREVVLADWDYFTRAGRSETITLFQNANSIWRLPMAEFQAMQIPASFQQYLQPYCIDSQSAEDGLFHGFYTTDALKEAGFTVWTASAVRCIYDSVAIPQAAHLQNVFHSTQKGFADADGQLVTSWAVRYAHPQLAVPAIRVAAAAANGAAEAADAVWLADYAAEEFGGDGADFSIATQRAGEPLPLSESRTLKQARALLQQGRDPFAELLTELEAGKSDLSPPDYVATPAASAASATPAAWRAALVAALEQTRQRHADARVRLVALQRQAKRNRETLDLWIEGIDWLLFCADFQLAVYGDALEREGADLERRLIALREKTRVLWEKTFCERAVAAELEMRYAFFSEYMGIENGDQDEAPLCLQCLQPVSPLDHYCPHCGQSVGQLTAYLPYEGIWFNAGLWAKLWNRLWYRRVDSLPRKCFFLMLIVLTAPILLLALPTVWWWKSKSRSEDSTERPNESPAAKTGSPPKCIKQAENIVRDARFAVLVGLIPILSLIYILRLVQWYIVSKELADFDNADRNHHAQLLSAFRLARPRLWFALLFWPGIVAFLAIYIAVT